MICASVPGVFAQRPRQIAESEEVNRGDNSQGVLRLPQLLPRRAYELQT